MIAKFGVIYNPVFYYFYFMQIADNIRQLKQTIPSGVRIVAVSKTVPETLILEAYRSGHRLFGENRVQDLVKKRLNLPADMEWHMIGHLQSNKVKYIAPFVSLIHSVDNADLLSVINREAMKNDRIIPCLLQIRIAKEETKYGLTFEEAVEILSSSAFRAMEHIKISGLMGMATFTDDMAMVRSEFRYLATCFRQIKADLFMHDLQFRELSMGMSGDYPVALEEGATLLRIGTLIFGLRT
jgi:pyridoxal phosphate enzyme (YggS family)